MMRSPFPIPLFPLTNPSSLCYNTKAAENGTRYFFGVCAQTLRKCEAVARTNPVRCSNRNKKLNIGACAQTLRQCEAVARDVWEQDTDHLHRKTQKTPKTLENIDFFRQLVLFQNRCEKRFDHLRKNLKNSIFFTHRGVAQLVARDVWDVDAAGSNPVAPTKNRGFDRTKTAKQGCFAVFNFKKAERGSR